MGTEIDSRVVGSTPLEKQVAATGNWDPGMAGRYQGHGAFQSDEPSVHFALVSVFVRQHKFGKCVPKALRSYLQVLV